MHMMLILHMVQTMSLALIIYVIIWSYIKNKRCSVHFIYAVIDEVDSILIDEARTPLIISGSAQKSAQLYIQANAFVRTLTKDKDYTYDEKTKGVQLTEEGINKAERGV